MNTNFWLIGMIIDINEEKEQLFLKYNDKERNVQEEWINIFSQRIAPFEQNTRGTGTGSLLNTEEINQK